MDSVAVIDVVPLPMSCSGSAIYLRATAFRFFLRKLGGSVELGSCSNDVDMVVEIGSEDEAFDG